MLRPIRDTVWAFDTEWAPDPAAGRILYGLPPDLPDAAVLAEMWKRNGATEEDPFPFLKTVLCRVLSIAAVQRRSVGGQTKLDLIWLPRDCEDPVQSAEAAIVGRFLDAVGKHKPQLVGFNSQAADLRILTQRAVVLGLSVAEFCRRPDKPWEASPDYLDRRNQNDWNLDLMELLSSWGKGALSLHEIASLSGIPGKFGAAGEQVAHMWLAGQWKAVVQYNCCDALSTYLLWLRLAYVSGRFTREQYDEEQEHVRQLLMDLAEAPDGEWASAYFDEWTRLQEATGQL